MTRAPTFDDIFEVMSATSVGDTTARVILPNELQIDDTATKFAVALNLLLDDLAFAAAERAKRMDEIERMAVRLRILSGASHDFALATSNQRDLFNLIARRLCESVGELCAIRMLKQNSSRLVAEGTVHHPDPHTAATAREIMLDPGEGSNELMMGLVPASQEPMLITAITPQIMAELEPYLLALVGRLGVSSLLCVPLASSGHVLGSITLARCGPGHPYTQDDLRLVQDIADRAALAIENALLVADLEARVAERTAELEEANRELEAFSYTVSHDLRAPLRAIDGFSKALLNDCSKELNEQGQRYLERIRSGTQRMSALIDDLLNLSRITRTSLQRETVDLTALSRRIVVELKAREPARHVSVEIDDGLLTHADPRFVAVVLQNLIANAWKFSAKQAYSQIWIGQEKHGGETVFYIRDNGAGFDMKYGAKLFAPFQRLHKASEFEGTGVGLATVQRIVSRHGGRIWAESAVGRGATFFFTLEPKP